LLGTIIDGVIGYVSQRAMRSREESARIGSHLRLRSPRKSKSSST
jgi:hypothetical protein